MITVHKVLSQPYWITLTSFPLQLGPSTNSSSAEAAVSNETLSNSGGGGGGGGGSGSGGASASVSRSSMVTAITKTPIKGQPQTPPEEPADPVSYDTGKRVLERAKTFLN